MKVFTRLAIVALLLLFQGCDSKISLEERENIMRKIAMDMNKNTPDKEKIKILQPYCDKGIGEICFMIMLVEKTDTNSLSRANKEKYIKRLKDAYDNSIDPRTKRAIEGSIYYLREQLDK